VTAAQDLPVAIAGGGVGGLAAALALARKGFRAHVFEQTAEFKEIGAGIQLGPNVFRMFDRLGLAEEIERWAHFPDALTMRDALSGEEITRIPLGAGFRARFGRPYAVIHRADLHRVILDAARAEERVTLTPSRKVVGYEEHAGRVVVRLEGGEGVSCTALIGADGIWSVLRERIVGDGKPLVSGHIAYRAVLKRDEVPPDLWSPDVILWAGPRTHLVHYPLRRAKLFNLVAVFHSKRYVEGWNAEADAADLREHFKGQRPEVSRLLERIETWRMWVLCDREPVKDWSQGRITLLGDAAHPMLQYLAQGACMATEDACVLAEKASEAPDDLPAAFRAYVQQRYLRTARVQIMARVYGDFYHARGPAAELRNMMLGARTPEESYEGVAWLYGGME
jgi:salicylate hydroxylase